MPKIRAAILLSSCVLAVSALPLRAQQSAATPGISAEAAHDLLHELDDAFESVFEKVAPAVVIIDATRKVTADAQDQSFDYYFDSPENGQGPKPPHLPEPPTVHSEGSGFIVRPDGFIYTNFHVIEDADTVEVKLRDHRHFKAKVVGSDERTDIAVLKIDARDLPTVTLVDSDKVRVGQNCFAIGIPYNLDYSFCRGVVSAKGRGNLTSTPLKPVYEDYIQTDAFINPGNSGGPLFDVDGNVMGMTTLINGVGRGLSFAIPSNMLATVGPELIATGHATHPWLGITVSNREDAPSGAMVDQAICVQTVEADGPAYKSDLRPQDTIATVDGVPVLTAHDLQREILKKKIGQSVTLSISRNGRTFPISIVTEPLPADLTEVAKAHSKARIHPADSTAYGLEFAAVHPRDVAEPVGDGSGVTITAVNPGSPASRAGLQPGDVLTAVDQRAVSDAAHCMDLLAAHRGPTGPVLFITRDGHKASAVLDNNGGENP
jgi:S1-C subfamily serine protease